jgi:lysophospholipase L1-like esterase
MAFSHSALFRWADWTLRVAPRGERARKVGWMINKQGDIEGARRVDINDYAANLEAMSERMQAHGGGVVYVVPPNREDLLPPGEAPRWEVYRRAMRDVAARHHAPVVEGPAAFRASGLDVDALFQDQMHPTALGHAVLADAVAQVLSAAGWPGVPFQVQAADSPLQTYEDR